MHAMIADATQIVGEAAQRVLLSLSVKTSFVPSLNDLPLALEADGVPDLMIVNVTNNLTGWEISARLQRAGYQAPEHAVRRPTRLCDLARRHPETGGSGHAVADGAGTPRHRRPVAPDA